MAGIVAYLSVITLHTKGLNFLINDTDG
jgi:hypothetical protein